MITTSELDLFTWIASVCASSELVIMRIQRLWLDFYVFGKKFLFGKRENYNFFEILEFLKFDSNVTFGWEIMEHHYGSQKTKIRRQRKSYLKKEYFTTSGVRPDTQKLSCYHRFRWDFVSMVVGPELGTINRNRMNPS